MQKIHLFNTLTRKKEEFIPIKSGMVSLYTCGPTVYWFAHVGNLRTYLFEDLLKRTLEFNGYEVNHIMNITDVGHLTSDADTGEDKIEKAAAKEKRTVWDIAEFYTRAFQKDLKKLNIQTPSKWVKATDHINDQIALIKRLEAKHYTYRTKDGIYFDTSKLSDYGVLAQLDVKGLKAGARVETGEKRGPTDFALWKFSSADQKRQMEWDSPWGRGFPGWHIECSAMSMKYLGETFDIHCGGADHIPVHHVNEIAQSQAATGKKFVNYWLHGEFLTVGASGEKMAKSAGKIITLAELEERGINSLAYRYLNLTAHYRTPLQFTEENIKAAQSAYNHLVSWLRDIPLAKKGLPELEESFLAAINNDLDFPKAVALIWEAIKSGVDKSKLKKSLYKFDQVLGLNLKKIKKPAVPMVIKNLIKQRDRARADKNFSLADQIRSKIEEQGYQIDDTADGTFARLKINP